MRAIFISYRRDDAEGEAGRLFDDLASVLGEKAVFMDVAAIQVGRDFRKAIDESVATCGVLLAVIGKDWLDAKDDAGNRRLDNPSDFVRLETASALKRDIPVVPVLVRGAKMPRPEQLPDDLKELAYRNGVEITHPRWSSDLQLLIKALEPFVGASKADPSKATVAKLPEGAPQPTSGMQSAAADLQRTKAPLIGADSVPPPRKRSVGKILAIVAAAVVGIGVVSSMLAPQKVVVPDLSGSSVADARAKLAELQLQVGSIDHEVKAGPAGGTVFREYPAAGEQVERGSKVNLIVAEAPETPVTDTRSRAPEAHVQKSPIEQNVSNAASRTANEGSSNESPDANETPINREINLNGLWHNASGIPFQVSQRGETFTYTASAPTGVSRGTGTIRGLQFLSYYETALANGVRTSGRCSGTISADGKMIQASCFDSMAGASTDILVR